MDRQTIAAGWLTLRPFTPADIPWVYEVLRDPVLQRFMQVPSPCRLEDAASHVEREYIAGGDGRRLAEFVAEDAATATRLGRVGLRLGEPGVAEVGYWVDPRARKRGVATTAVRAVCQWAVTTAGIELIEWRCEAGNIASRRVAEKAGFLIEATLRKRRLLGGVRVDEWVGSLLRDEVLASPANSCPIIRKRNLSHIEDIPDLSLERRRLRTAPVDPNTSARFGLLRMKYDAILRLLETPVPGVRMDGSLAHGGADKTCSSHE
jgi:RimJ/RimL family protein N-acetyltransferase